MKYKWEVVKKRCEKNKEWIGSSTEDARLITDKIRSNQVLLMRSINHIATLNEIMQLKVAGDILGISAYILGISPFANKDDLQMIDAVAEISNKIGDGITSFSETDLTSLIHSTLHAYFPLFAAVMEEYIILNLMIDGDFVSRLMKLFFAGSLMGLSISESVQHEDEAPTSWLDGYSDYCTKLYNDITNQDRV